MKGPFRLESERPLDVNNRLPPHALGYATPRSCGAYASRAPFLGSALGVLSVVLALVAAALTASTRDGSLGGPAWLAATVVAVVGFTLTMAGALHGNSTRRRLNLLVGLLSNGAVLAVFFASFSWFIDRFLV